MSTISKIKVGGTTYDIAYPVGSIYLSVNNTSPAELFGGIWEQIKDRFLLAAGDTYTAGGTGGEEQHKLKESEMPDHNHGILKGDPISSDTGNPNLIQAKPNFYYAWADPKIDNKYYWQSHTSFTGGSKPHNNMPPYLTVYMWKRVA